MYPELEDFNPYEDMTEEFFLFEQAKIAQFTADVIRPIDEAGIGMINRLEGEANGILERLSE